MVWRRVADPENRFGFTLDVVVDDPVHRTHAVGARFTGGKHHRFVHELGIAQGELLHFGCSSKPQSSVKFQPILNRLARCAIEQHGQSEPILQRLSRALAGIYQHRVRSVAQQRDPAIDDAW